MSLNRAPAATVTHCTKLPQEPEEAVTILHACGRASLCTQFSFRVHVVRPGDTAGVYKLRRYGLRASESTLEQVPGVCHGRVKSSTEVTRCPVGHRLVNDSGHYVQNCVSCLVGKCIYSADLTDHTQIWQVFDAIV